MKNKQANRRIRLLLAIFVLVFAGTLARAVWLQGVRAASLGKMAERQHHESIVIPAGRGTIYDAAGVQLAIGETTTTVYADPRQLTQPRAIAVAAQKFLGVDANSLYPQLLDRKTSFLYVKRFADPKAAAAFLKKGFVGVNSYPEEKRAYPQRSVASQVIGFAGTDNKGLGGLEVEYNRNLTGKTGKQTIVRDPFGRAIDVLSMRRNSRATISSRRSITRSRRTPRQCSVRRSRGGTPSPRLPWCSIRAREPCLQWRRRPATTRTMRAECRSLCSATARSPTPTSPARRSSS